ncbi:lipopolysaccharide assembly protein LapA domain-containing protein [Nocardioides terrisoli]|uniref:lipopolysaccharide assembly protein LapA domain-containing protein n=1 Tax=Nocardioides terrisoli TaxID=3388267 RepID=UPI00287B6A7D|nr:lipopolysaccharide assembly protein LapA domain-containing protein [Nocardioides marmorisolisilvae]
MSENPGTDATTDAPDHGVRHDPLRHSRTSRTWAALFAFGVILVLLIIFIAQNTQTVQVSFLGWSGHAPLAVALLIAAAAAILITAVAGTLRILQLRRRVTRDNRRRR